jgi:hypothetical protein
MASTRNINTPVNYRLEERKYQTVQEHVMYENAAHGQAWDTKIAGNGLNPGNMPWNKLSTNSSDIESFLFGINSTNLINPAGPLRPELTSLSSANVFEKSPVYMPNPLFVEKYQRPLAP